MMRRLPLFLFASLALAGTVSSLAGQAAQVGGAAVIPDGLRVETEEQRYEIEADRLDQVVSILNEMRLEGEDGPYSQGLTDYRVVPEWSFNAVEGGCAITSATVDVSIKITLPRWPGAARALEMDQRRWSEILLRITRHEYRHRDITVAVATELLTTLKGLGAGTCTAVRRAAEGALALARAELTKRHADFDEIDGRVPAP